MSPRSSKGFFGTLTHRPWPLAVGIGLAGSAAIAWGVPALVAAFGGKIAQTMAAPPIPAIVSAVAALFLVACLIAASISFLTAGSRAKAVDAQAKIESVRSLTWNQIEQVIGEAYRRRGFNVERASLGGDGGGLDLLLTKDGVTTLVQCRHWRSQHVGVSVVREFEKLMEQHRFAAGKILCAGVFSTDCFRFAVGKPIELVDGDRLQPMVAAVRADTTLAPPA
jgi:restriction system protein